jgi:predicted RNA binding protein YcfA (HicA-like mRNA interferase family)
MSRFEKLIARVASRPRDFTWQELQTLMSHLGYSEKRGKGSGRKFVHLDGQTMFTIHEPHPGKILKPYAIKGLIQHLQKSGLL